MTARGRAKNDRVFERGIDYNTSKKNETVQNIDSIIHKFHFVQMKNAGDFGEIINLRKWQKGCRS